MVGLVFYAARTILYQKPREDPRPREGRWLVPYDLVAACLFSVLIFRYTQRCQLTLEKAGLYRQRYATELPAGTTPL